MTLSRIKVTFAVVCLLLGAGVQGAQASSIAINFTNTTGLQLGNPSFTLGWSFSVAQDLNVTSLGLFDSSQDGLADRYNIGLWDSSQSLLVSTTLPSGTSATLVDKFRFQAVAPTLLLAGQSYYIGALFSSSSDGLIFPGDATGFSADSAVTFLASQFVSGGSLAFPGDSAGAQPAYIGPNFQFEAAAVPEPATLVLLGTGLAAAGVLRRLKRRV